MNLQASDSWMNDALIYRWNLRPPMHYIGDIMEKTGDIMTLKNGGHFQSTNAYDPFHSLMVSEEAHILT